MMLRFSDNKTAMNVILIAVIVIAIGVLIWRLQSSGPKVAAPPPREPVPVYFYDLNTGELFAGRSNQVPPIEAPSGPLPDGSPAGVGAYVIEYVDAPGERHIVYLERFVGEAVEAYRRYKQDTEQGTLGPESAEAFRIAQRGREISAPDQIAWVNISEEGQPDFVDELMREAGQRGTYRAVRP